MTERVAQIFRISLVMVAVALVCASRLSSASAAPQIQINVKMRPEKLGQSTTVSLIFQIDHNSDQMPSSLTGFDVLLPAEMGLGSSTLGLNTCSSETLIRYGPSSCPQNAQMGVGNAIVEASLGLQIVNEPAPVSVFMAKENDGKTTLLVYFEGNRPVIAPLVFPSVFTASGNSPRSEFQLVVPAIPGLPETPDTAIVHMELNIGPEDLTYYRHVGKKLQSYKPMGMNVPATCPRGGFPFSMYFSFLDGSRATEAKKVPCPATGKR